MSDVEQELKERIFCELEALGDEYRWIIDDFRTITKDHVISNKLKKAYIQTAVRGYLNKHGVVHGLTTTYNALKLFKLIHEDTIESDYVKDFGYPKDQVLFCIVVASYVHDIGRFYPRNISHEPRISDALEILSKIAEAGAILRGLKPVVWRQLLDRVRELCLCHDQKKEDSEKTEIALIKLADALHCTKERAYSEIDNEDLRVGYSDRMRIIFKKDKRPEDLFACLSVNEARIDWNEQEDIITVTIEIKDYAATPILKCIIDILRGCQRSPETVQKMAEKIRVIVRDPQEEYTLYPMETISIPGGKFLLISYEIDIQNMKGDAVIKGRYILKNVREKSGIAQHTFKMWGLRTTKWGKDVKIRSFDGEGQQLQTKYDRPVGGGKGHIWTVIFPNPISINQEIQIKGDYSWKGFVDVKNDEFVRIVKTPTEALNFKIYFPREIEKEKIEAHFELKKEKATLLTLPLSAHYDKKFKRAFVQQIANDQKKGFTYRIFWKISA